MSRNVGSTIILFFIFKNRKHKIYSKGHKVCTFCTRFSNFYTEIMLLSIFEKKNWRRVSKQNLNNAKYYKNQGKINP